MAEAMDVTDDMQSTAAKKPMERMPTRSSACLAEKLKKLMDTPKPTTGNEAMDCESDEMKKRSRSKDGKTTESQGQTVNESNPPEIK